MKLILKHPLTLGVISLSDIPALAEGFGSGEYSGYFSNMRALTTTLGPLIYGNLYARIAAAKPAAAKPAAKPSAPVIPFCPRPEEVD